LEVPTKGDRTSKLKGPVPVLSGPLEICSSKKGVRKEKKEFFR
jgi:hypothetical protein